MSDSAPHHRLATSQILEDLACAYWSSDTLFAALELDLFATLGEETLPLSVLAQKADCRPAPLSRLLTALTGLKLLQEENGSWQNLPVASHHLIPGRPDYLGDFLLYRRYLQPTWQTLAQSISLRPLPPGLSREDDYPTRNRHYVRALDQLARIKAKEIIAELSCLPWHGPVLDVGGGAGALSRALLQDHPQQAVSATLFDLPEILTSARELYPSPDKWRGITPLAGEFQSHSFAEEGQFGLVAFSNFLHIYDQTDAKNCLAKAATLLTTSGHLLIHDYCSDRRGIKGPLYDLNMLVNTTHGRCHQACELAAWLAGLGLTETRIIDLASDSTMIIARRPPC